MNIKKATRPDARRVRTPKHVRRKPIGSNPTRRERTAYIFASPPFGGKSELLKACKRRFKATFVGSGECCRDEAKQKTQAWRRAKQHMESTGSTLWPTSELFPVLEKKLRSMKPLEDDIFLDGCLRATDQVEKVVALMPKFGITRIVIIWVNTSDATCREREAIRPPRVGDQPVDVRLQDWHEHGVAAMHEILRAVGTINVSCIEFSGESMLKDKWAFAKSLHLAHKIPLLVRKRKRPSSGFHPVVQQ